MLTPFCALPILTMTSSPTHRACSTGAKCGKGSFAQCYTAKHNMTGQLACMKVIDLCPKKVDVPDVRAELGFLNQLQHPNCMRLIAFDIDITLTVTMLIASKTPNEPHYPAGISKRLDRGP